MYHGEENRLEEESNAEDHSVTGLYVLKVSLLAPYLTDYIIPNENQETRCSQIQGYISLLFFFATASVFGVIEQEAIIG